MNSFRIFDSHMHFNTRSEYCQREFEQQIISNNLAGYLLILNSDAEKEFFLKNYLSSFVGSKRHKNLAFLLDYKKEEDILLRELIDTSIPFSIKLHPRLTEIVLEDFPKILIFLEKFNYQNIIVDCFYFGSKLRNHINLELAIFLAKNLPDKKILIAHSGGHKALECMLYTRDLKNVYYDISLTMTYLRHTSVRLDLLNLLRYNFNKVVFGSDYPDFTIDFSLNVFFKYAEELNLSQEIISQILYYNAVQFFDLKGAVNETKNN